MKNNYRITAGGSPDIPPPPPPQIPPPPAAETAQNLKETKGKISRTKKRGKSALVIKRPLPTTGQQGGGLQI